MQLKNYLDGDKYEEYKIYDSIVDKNIKNEMKEADWCTDLIQYTIYKSKIDGLIASAYLFCHQIIQVKNYVFMK